jgi:hypothetical protein
LIDATAMPDILTILDFAAGGLALVLASRFLASCRRSTPPPPPGPKGLPFIGNVFDMPTEQEWYTFADWATRYGMIPLLFSIRYVLLMLTSKVTLCRSPSSVNRC